MKHYSPIVLVALALLAGCATVPCEPGDKVCEDSAQEQTTGAMLDAAVIGLNAAWTLLLLR